MQGLPYFHLFTWKARAGPQLRQASLLRENYSWRSRLGRCRSKCSYLLSHWECALSTRRVLVTVACTGLSGWAAPGAGAPSLSGTRVSLENARKRHFLLAGLSASRAGLTGCGSPGQISSFSRTMRKQEKAATADPRLIFAEASGFLERPADREKLPACSWPSLSALQKFQEASNGMAVCGGEGGACVCVCACVCSCFECGLYPFDVRIFKVFSRRNSVSPEDPVVPPGAHCGFGG